MTLTARSSLRDVAAAVASSLRDAGIDAVLTGGACATVYSDGRYMSHDLDFIIRSGATRAGLDEAMASAGFSRKGDHYVHPRTPLFVEFPRGPLAIGDDFDITPVPLRLAGRTVRALSATDACRDRLAAFYHWSDRQSLQAAVEIARRRSVNLSVVKRWSRHEGFEDRYEEFRQALKRRR